MKYCELSNGETASLYDNFCKTGNYVICDVIIWVQDGNCKKMARQNFSIGAFYNITKLETVSIAEPLQNRQHAPLMLSTLGSKEKREGG